MHSTQLAYLRFITAQYLRSIASNIDFKATQSAKSPPDGSMSQAASSEAPEASEGLSEPRGANVHECLARIRSNPATNADVVQVRQEIDTLAESVAEAVRRIDLTLEHIEESVSDLHRANRRMDAAIERIGGGK